MRVPRHLALGLAIFVAGPFPAESGSPAGPQFQVNSTTPGDQIRPSAAADAAGNWVVVWQSKSSTGTDQSSWSIQARQYAADGTPQGEDSQVNAYTTSGQFRPAVAMNDAGDFVVVWGSYAGSGTDTSASGIQARRFAAGGTPLGDDFQVNTNTLYSQRRAAVAIDSGGRFLVVWLNLMFELPGSGLTSIQGQSYAADGTPRGGELRVDTHTAGLHKAPAVATSPGGDFVVAWESSSSAGTDTHQSSIQARRFAADGTPRGAQFQVNTNTLSEQSEATVAAGAGGDFVIAWTSDASTGTDSHYTSIQAKVFSSDGTPRGPDFQVNTSTLFEQFYPSVAIDAAGEFVVAWVSEGTQDFYYEIRAQRLAADGQPLGGELLVNTYATTLQSKPSVAMDPAGHFVVAWMSDGSPGTDTSRYSIQARRYRAPIFSDGFESGDTSAWSGR